MRWVLAAILAVGAAAVVAVIGGVVVALFGAMFLAGTLIGSAASLTLAWARARNRRDHLRELVDWLGEELEARRNADLRRERRVRALRADLP